MNEHMNEEPRRGLDTPKLVLGLFLVALGVTFLLDRLYWWPYDLVRLWPLWLIAFGVLRVAFPRPGRGRIAGFWPILIGVMFLLDVLDVMHLRDSWPLFIVGAGFLMMLRATGVARQGRCHDGCMPPEPKR